MNLLVLLTSSFPYGTGEEFLLNELNYIRGFDRVVICPCGVKPGSKQTKPLKNGIECFPVSYERKRFGYAEVILNRHVVREIAELIGAGRFSAGRMHELLFFSKNAVNIFHSLKNLPDLEKADRVTIYSYWFYDGAAAGALFKDYLLKCGKSVRLISRAHGFDIHAERAKYGYLPLRRFLVKHCDGVFPCSSDGSGILKKQFPAYGGKIRMAHLGTKDHGIKYGSRNGFRILSCSYMVPVKRLHLIAEALKNADFPVIWTHLGSGPLENELKAAAKELPKCVKCEFKGSMENSDVMNYYKNNNISVFVNVSSSEGIPVSIMEACSFGIPVIATDVGGTHEIVQNGENGFLLTPDFSATEFLDKLNLIKDMEDEAYTKMCEKSRSIWSDKFSAEKNYSEFYEVLGK